MGRVRTCARRDCGEVGELRMFGRWFCPIHWLQARARHNLATKWLRRSA